MCAAGSLERVFTDHFVFRYPKDIFQDPRSLEASLSSFSIYLFLVCLFAWFSPTLTHCFHAAVGWN